MTGTSTPLRAVVVGSINTDLVAAVPQLPAVGATLFARSVESRVGGKGANQAVALARLGASVTMVGAIGDDDEAATIRAGLAAERVGCEAVVSTRSRTGLAIVLVDPDGRNSIVVAQGANAELTPAQVSRALPSGELDCALFQLEVPVPVVAAAIRGVRSRTRWLILNAAPAVPLPDGLLADVDVLVVNEIEAVQLSGLADPVGAGELLAGQVRRFAVVTMGGSGALLAEPGRPTLRVPALPAEVVDTTGAGDSFVAALAFDLARGSSTATALGFASRAAAVAVTRHGAQASMPLLGEIEPEADRAPGDGTDNRC